MATGRCAPATSEILSEPDWIGRMPRDDQRARCASGEGNRRCG